MTALPRRKIPILLLKTKSQPHDAYEEYFSSAIDNANQTSYDLGNANQTSYDPEFVPVLEHRPHAENLGVLEELLRKGTLRQKYGGMIFTSQRAVEGWAGVVKRVEQSITQDGGIGSQASSRGTNKSSTSNPNHSQSVTDQLSFPLYSVGPATSRGLNTLISQSCVLSNSPFATLKPVVVGAHTGNGEALAQYILRHYNLLRSRGVFSLDETPNPDQNISAEYSISNAQLDGKSLLFLVGEVRRDIIPKTLMDPDHKLQVWERIQVDEMEVYGTSIMASFATDFQQKISAYVTSLTNESESRFMVVVVFSPQGCEAMLKTLGFIDEHKRLTELATSRWTGSSPSLTKDGISVVIATIGPTTRDHLKDKFNFEVDVCAIKPSPEGVGAGIQAFLQEKGLL